MNVCHSKLGDQLGESLRRQTFNKDVCTLFCRADMTGLQNLDMFDPIIIDRIMGSADCGLIITKHSDRLFIKNSHLLENSSDPKDFVNPAGHSPEFCFST